MPGMNRTTDSSSRYPSWNVPALVSALASKHGFERQRAREKLTSLGKLAVPALVRCLADSRRQVRWEAAKALGRIRDPSAAGALVGALEDPDSDVRWLAASALVGLGHAGLRPLLVALVERSHSEWLREGAHHVCHDLAKTHESKPVRPVFEALNCPEPALAVPGAAFSALKAL